MTNEKVKTVSIRELVVLLDNDIACFMANNDESDHAMFLGNVNKTKQQINEKLDRLAEIVDRFKYSMNCNSCPDGEDTCNTINEHPCKYELQLISDAKQILGVTE